VNINLHRQRMGMDRSRRCHHRHHDQHNRSHQECHRWLIRRRRYYPWQ
jgi:hypothetical protein